MPTPGLAPSDIAARQEEDRHMAAGVPEQLSPDSGREASTRDTENPKNISPAAELGHHSSTGTSVDRDEVPSMAERAPREESRGAANVEEPPAAPRERDAGHGLEPPKSSYYYGPPPTDAAYGTDPVGTIGVHYPREIVRIERDYEHGELCQFSSAFPLELEGRLTPTEFLDAINAINEVLISAYSLRDAMVDNILAVFTLYLSRLIRRSHYDKEMERLEKLIEDMNVNAFHGRGLHILWPRKTAFLFLEIEYY